MTNESYWETVEAILADAAEVNGPQRAALLEARCAERPELRAEVESLLAAHDRAPEWIAPATRPANADATADTAVGGHIGAFRLIERLGDGGMGTVFLAERADGAFDQRVAIKVIGSWLREADAIARFRVERQILASLQHPNIVTLLDGGVTQEGQPYLVMEYVDGLPITRYCATRALTVHQRLTLFRHVCGAVHFAHGHLIVHRDLKPANLLVTATGVPIVLDFGVAKLLDTPAGSADATRTGLLPGPLTPNYASPEQLRGLPITTACDVYALGVLLYELLTGTRPYDATGKTIDEVLAVATARSRASRPSAAPVDSSAPPPIERRLLRGDLDAIVLKAMDPDPARRYTSASELADDVGRFLARRPIVAREVSFAYLARKMASRHRVATVVGVVSLVAVIAMLGVAIWQRQTARRAQARAEARFADVRQLANALIFKIHDAVEPLAGSTPVRQVIVAEGLKYLDGLGAESREPALALELAKAYRRIGNIQGSEGDSNLGDRAAAIASLEKGLAALSLALPSDDPAPLALEGAQINLELSQALIDVGRHDEALAAVHTAERTAEALARGSSVASDAEATLADVYSTLSSILDVKETLPYRMKALEIREKKLAQQPNDLSRQRNAALAAKYVGAYYDKFNDFPRALEYYSRARTLDEARLAAQPADRLAQFDIAIDVSNIAGVQSSIGQDDKALEHYLKSLAIRRHLADTDPKDAFMRSRVAFLEARIGRLYAKLNDEAKALQHLEAAVATARALASISPAETSQLADYLDALGANQLAFNRRTQACATFREAHQILTSLAGSTLGFRTGINREVQASVEKGLKACRGR